MWAVKGRSKDEEAHQIIMEALLCKAFGCLPSELRNEDAEEVYMKGLALAEIMKKNPLI